MEGVMTPLFCRAFHHLHLTEGWLTPYYRVTTNVPKDAKLKKFIQPYMENNLPVIVQLMGTDASLLTKVAERMVLLGAKGININFSCPSKQVLKSKAGGALLRDIPLMMKILHSIKNALPETSLSVKIRCGFEDWRESENIITSFIKTASLDFIGVHFRTVKENYSPVPPGIKRLKHIVALAGKVPIIGSGDVFSKEDAQNFLKLGCAGAMIARGVLRNPFLIHNLQQTEKNKLSSEKGRQYFFKTLQKIAESDERLYSRAKFLEYAAMMWGANSKQFSALKELKAKEFLNFKI
jgi:tRNA-dihydrouridine synthase C